MNKTKIEWADYTWNPVTGCLHGCEYCYARGIAKRFGGGEAWDRGSSHDPELHVLHTKPEKPFPYYFAPTLHWHRMEEPQHKMKPQTIFVCSMADLFGEWVPDEWIADVIKACEAAPQHRYLFLTKNPMRYLGLSAKEMLPENNNFWFGSTVTGEYEPSMWSDNHNTLTSIEPLLSRFSDTDSSAFKTDWVIIGAETGNRKNKVVPERSWIDDIVEYCAYIGTPVFMKDSLIPIVGEENMLREYPWETV